jgi:hypothetical protein
VAGRPKLLFIAVLLTVLDVLVDLSYGWPVWTAWPGDVWNRGLELLLATLGATSLASVWAQVASAEVAPAVVKTIDHGQTAAVLSAQARGQANV